MIHKILIWSKNKGTGKNFHIENRSEITEDQIRELALQEYSNCYNLDDDKDYFAEIDQTVI